MAEFADPGSVPPILPWIYDSNANVVPIVKPAEGEKEADLDATNEATDELLVVEFYPVSIIASGTFSGELHVQVRKGSAGDWRETGEVIYGIGEGAHLPKFRDCRIRVKALNWVSGSAHVEVRQG